MQVAGTTPPYMNAARHDARKRKRPPVKLDAVAAANAIHDRGLAGWRLGRGRRRRRWRNRWRRRRCRRRCCGLWL
eukprot:2748932-Pyramimonas_sp.AAC.1